MNRRNLLSTVGMLAHLCILSDAYETIPELLAIMPGIVGSFNTQRSWSACKDVDIMLNYSQSLCLTIIAGVTAYPQIASPCSGSQNSGDILCRSLMPITTAFYCCLAFQEILISSSAAQVSL